MCEGGVRRKWRDLVTWRGFLVANELFEPLEELRRTTEKALHQGDEVVARNDLLAEEVEALEEFRVDVLVVEELLDTVKVLDLLEISCLNLKLGANLANGGSQTLVVDHLRARGSGLQFLGKIGDRKALEVFFLNTKRIKDIANLLGRACGGRSGSSVIPGII